MADTTVAPVEDKSFLNSAFEVSAGYAQYALKQAGVVAGFIADQFEIAPDSIADKTITAVQGAVAAIPEDSVARRIIDEAKKVAADSALTSGTPDEILKLIRENTPEENRADVEKFLAVLDKHPDLKESFGKMVNDEGYAGVDGLRDMLMGEGALDADTFAKMMEKDAYRAMVVDVFEATGSDKFQMGDAVKFSRLAAKAMKDPNDKEARNAFLKQGEAMGADMEAVKKQYMQEQLGLGGDTDFSKMWDTFRTNPEGFWQQLQGMLVTVFDSMGLSPEWSNKLLGVATIGAGLGTEIANNTINGDPKTGQPGVVDIAARMGDELEEISQQTRRNAAMAPALN